jgi:hypothetical protein
MPNFTLVDVSGPEIASLLAAMLEAREAIERRSWSHPQNLRAMTRGVDCGPTCRARKQSRPGLHSQT